MFNLSDNEKLALLILSILLFLTILILAKENVIVSSSVSREKPALLSSGRVNEIVNSYRYVNINSGDVNELMRLKGIGPVLAGRILEYRKANGPFKEKDKLMRVKGIGRKCFDENEKFIRLE